MTLTLVSAAPALPPGVALRPATNADERFLFEVFTWTRAAEMAALRVDQRLKAKFLRQQYAGQKAGYSASHPENRHFVVTLHGKSIGRYWVAESAHEVRVLDIALLPKFAREDRKVGLVALAQAAAERARRPLRLCVLKLEPHEEAFYAALGFRRVGEQELRYEMEWLPPTS